MADQQPYQIASYRVTELADELGISKASVSEKLKAIEHGIEKSKTSNRITAVKPEAVQEYFISRGCSYLYAKTVILAVQSCAGGLGKSSISQGLMSQARRMKAQHKTIIDGKEISPAVVILDYDSQSSTTSTLLGNPVDDSLPVLKHFLANEASIDEILTPVGNETYVIGSNLQNLYLDKQLNSVSAIKNAGMKLIADLDKKFGRGYVLIVDSPPALSAFNQSLVVAMSQLDPARYNTALLAPIRALDRYGIKASEITITEAREILAAFNLPECRMVSFLTMYQRVGKTSVEVLKNVILSPILKDTLLDLVVRHSHEFSKANMSSRSIFDGKNTPATEDISGLYLHILGYEKPIVGNA